MGFLNDSLAALNRLCAYALFASFMGTVVPVTGDDTWTKQIRPFLDQHCIDCHGEEEPEADLDLATFGDAVPAPSTRETWVNILDMLQRGHMPPEGAPQPNPEELQGVTQALQKFLLTLDGIDNQDPGHVTLRRLNRTEYNHVIADLFGIDVQPAQDFPADDTGYGFDNIGAVLSLSPVLFEKYLLTAEKITDTLMDNSSGASDIFVCRPDDRHDWEACAQRILKPIACRAFRRPVRNEELNGLVRLVHHAKTNGQTFEHGIQMALQAIMVSPYFLFHVVQVPEANKVSPLDEFELAARLSFFLWSRGPDDELYRLAEQSQLHNETVLTAQVQRMLAHEHTSALSNNFASQWLQLANLDLIAPNPELFPTFDDKLRHASRLETELFFASILRDDLSILTLLDADFSFLNERLAHHYGITDVVGSHFRRVSFNNNQRGGLLSHASILAITSNPTRTSPVKRGKWILEEILGTPLPPPPPDVENLSEDKDKIASSSLRERLEEHRSKESCASCHQIMDPLGFSLENYDAIGSWRERDGKFPINAAGTLPDGTFFDGPIGLKETLLKRKGDFVRCLSEKMLTYALGRGIEYYDQTAIKEIVAAVEQDEYRMSRLILEVVKSVPFQMKR